MTYEFTKHAEKEFLKLPLNIQVRVLKKIESFLRTSNPLSFAKPLVGTTKTFRFKIGDYRAIFDWQKDYILILRVGHRREIYKK